MAPASDSQVLISQAAEQLSQAVRETGHAPNEFAKALLELIEVSSKVAEFDAMAAAANVEAQSDEAKQWQEISLLTLKYCRQSLMEQQQRAIQEVCGLAEQGSSLFSKPAAPTTSVQPAAPEQAACAGPPGVWAARPPPGLAPPPGLGLPSPPPPGFEVCTKAKVETAKAQPKKATPTPPWRKTPKEPTVAAKQPEAKPAATSPAPAPAAAVVAMPVAVGVGCALNLDAYSDGDDSDAE